MMDHITPLSVTRAKSADDGPAVYGVVAEFANQGPILMEAEGQSTSYQAAMDRCAKFAKQPGILRVAVVRLSLENGNSLILHDMERIQT